MYLVFLLVQLFKIVQSLTGFFIAVPELTFRNRFGEIMSGE